MKLQRYKILVLYYGIGWFICCLIIIPPAFGQTIEERLYTSYQRITSLNEESNLISLEEVVESIEQSHNISFFYKSHLIENKLLPEIVLNNDSLATEFSNILAGFGLTYKQHTARTYLIMELDHPDAEHMSDSMLQEQVEGRVVDATTGETLPGVNIVVEGTNIGTVTNINGEYSVSVPGSESVLVFSYVGYVSQRITVGDRSEIDISLQQDLSQLDEVVVIGYGTVRRADLTGAVSQVNASDFERVPATNPLLSLQGRAPGLRIIPNSGEPGASASIRVRGEQSISGTNSPIFVVDGNITNNIDNISSQDIEAVSVLKDASAVAIYGSRAANGVILINTKRGTVNSPPTINFHSYRGIQQQSNLRLELLDADEFLQLWTEAHTNSGITPPWTESDLAAYEGVNSDWLGAITGNGYMSNFDLSVAGGSDQSNYYVSASHIDHQGMVMGLDYNRTNLRLNTDHTIQDWIKFGNSLNIFTGKQNSDADQYVGALQKVPLTRIYEDDGSWGRIRNTPLEHIHQNPLWQSQNVRERIQRGLIGNLYLTLTFLEELEFTSRASAEWTNDYRTNFNLGVPSGLGWEGSNINSLAKDNRETLFWQADFLLNYESSLGIDHYVSGLLGYSIEEQTFERLWADGTGTPTNEIRFLNAVDPTSQRNTNTFSDWSFEALFARAGYTFRDKYILNATLRRDGTSRLDAANRYGIFPSVSTAWRIGEENFMQGIDWLNELKFRASWGTVGNVLSISTYGTKANLTNWNYAMNQQQSQGYTLASAINTDLVWESTNKKNIGLDIEVFDNRFYGIVDVFIEDTQDLLFSQPIPNSTGLVGSPFINAGHIRNTGIEFDLGYRQMAEDWRYSVSVNLTHFKNEVIDLEGRDLRTSGIEEGYPLRSFFGYKSNGIIRTQEDLDNHPHYPGKQIGDIWLLDENGDGTVNAEDRTIIGDNYPDIIYGAMGTIGYKHLTMQVQLQGVHGVFKDIRGGHNLGVLHYFTQWAKNHDRLILDRYHPTENPDGNYPRVTVDDAGNNLMVSDFWLSDASFLRISNLNLNYDFPAVFNQKVGLNNLSAYISVQNFYTFTNFHGPEVDSNADVLTGVPQPRTWTFGLRAGF